MNESLSPGPDLDHMIRLIRERWPDAAVATIEGAIFFSLDDKHWPNFVTIVWTDAFDEGAPSNLARPGTYRVNIGIGGDTFRGLVGSVSEPDYTASDRLLPHPVYAKQHWISILNPSFATVRDTVLPLVAEAHDRLVAVRNRRERAMAGG